MFLNSLLLRSVRLQDAAENQATQVYQCSGMSAFRAIKGEGKLARKIGRFEKSRVNFS